MPQILRSARSAADATPPKTDARLQPPLFWVEDCATGAAPTAHVAPLIATRQRDHPPLVD